MGPDTWSGDRKEGALVGGTACAKPCRAEAARASQERRRCPGPGHGASEDRKPGLDLKASRFLSFFSAFVLFLYLLATPGLRCSAWASNCSERGLLTSCGVRVAPLVLELGL